MEEFGMVFDKGRPVQESFATAGEKVIYMQRTSTS